MPKARRASAPAKRRWSSDVTARSNALDLEDRVFLLPPRQMAQSLKRSALRSKRRKAPAYRSAMSMLTFYQNRAGRNLSPARRRAIARAKDELRALFHRPPAKRALTSKRATRTTGAGHEGRHPRRHRTARRRPGARARRA
jgi:hypothetical protein